MHKNALPSSIILEKYCQCSPIWNTAGPLIYNRHMQKFLILLFQYFLIKVIITLILLYDQFRISQDSSSMFGFEFDGQLYTYQVLPYGFRASAYIVQTFTYAVAEYLRRQGHRIFIYHTVCIKNTLIHKKL